MTAPVFDNVSGQTWEGSTGSFSHSSSAVAGIAIGIIHASGNMTAGSCTYNGLSLTQLHLSSRLWIGYLLNVPTGNLPVNFTKNGIARCAYTFLTFSYVLQLPPVVLEAGTWNINGAYDPPDAVGANDMCLVGCSLNDRDSFDPFSMTGWTRAANWVWMPNNHIANVHYRLGGGTGSYDWEGNYPGAGFSIQLKEYVGGRSFYIPVIIGG